MGKFLNFTKIGEFINFVEIEKFSIRIIGLSGMDASAYPKVSLPVRIFA